MYPTKTFLEKFQLFIKILWPILVTQISLNAMNVVDTIMSGRVSAQDLAGVAIGSSIWLPVNMGLGGILIAVSPIVAQHLGAGKKEEITKTVMQAIYLSIVIAISILIAGFFLLKPILSVMNLQPQVEYIAFHYLVGLAFGIIPLFIAFVLRYFFDSLGYTRITMTIILLAVPINVFFNYLLIFGKFGAPKLGGIGAGYATAITYFIVMIISVIMALKLKRIAGYRLFRVKVYPSAKTWLEQLKIGIPIGLSIFSEASIFAIVTLLMSQFNTIIIASHQAAMNFSSLIFMIPLSISMSLTIVVGYEVGAKRIGEAIKYTKLGISVALCIMVASSTCLLLFKEDIAKFYSTDLEVIALTQQFLMFAIFYQLSDTLQVSIQGVLRGYKDVTVAFIIAFIAYWLIGLPAGFILANYTALEPFGYWVGIIVGLTAAAIGFMTRLLIIQKRHRIKMEGLGQ